ncbi:DUF2605 domain-containing protein [Tychonema sp. LEGE 07203]|uniref:DUF2605 domain-containing protein n=1 Tax=Tychonema sp. LEGE 07203 TaxID=1828671 RepID=UPI0018818850|nr:DUF2605 domain-containing protein [Tychonema sp. LEGE 07203]MBE9096142.1 DUF2605 domain-containing protein [Tychonema sp. LEGE 07203]
MPDSNLPESELLKSLLEPLLEDFNYWFARSTKLLETEEIHFLSDEDQSDLLARVKQAQQEVGAAKALFQATGGQVAIETSALMPWHRLLAECWQVSARFRSWQATPPKQ